MRTDRLELRPITLDDVDACVELTNDPEVMAYLTGGPPQSREETITRSIGHRWMAYEDGVFIGWFALQPANGGEYELGYRLRRDAWGRGLATEGCGALLARAFDDLGATRVFAQTMAVNTRSRAVMERLGMTYARTFHVHFDDPIPGTEEGEVEYELLTPR